MRLPSWARGFESLRLRYLHNHSGSYMSNKDRSSSNKKRIIISLFSSLFIFLCYIPVYLAYYPGVFAYDISYQTSMILGDIPLSTQQPVVHTLLWGLIMKLAGIVGLSDIVLYSVLQIIFVSISLGYIIYKLFKFEKKSNYVWLAVFLLFWALNPILSFMSFSTCKNICFGCFLLCLCTDIYKCLSSEKQKKTLYIEICITTLISCLFLNNFFYVIILYLVIAIIANKFITNKKLLYSLAIGIIVYFLINNIGFSLAKIEKGPSKEMLCVPLQQMIYAVERGKIDIDHEIAIREYFYNGDYGYFQLGNVDEIKRNFSEEQFDENKIEFFKLYVHTLCKDPIGATYSFLRLNYPLWAPKPVDIRKYAMIHYLESFSYEGVPDSYHGFVRSSKLPFIYEVFESITSFNAFESSFILKFIFGVSFPFWVFVICTINLIRKKEHSKIWAIIPYYLLWGTHLLGPLSNMRYVYPMILAIPLILFYSFTKKE